MKYIIWIIAFALFSAKANSQEFKYLYDTPSESVIIDAIESDSTYILVGYEGKQPNCFPLFVEVSKNGFLVKDSLNHSNYGFFNISLVEYNNNFLLVQSNLNGLNGFQQKRIEVTEVDRNMDSIGFHYEFNDTINYYSQKAKLVSDSELVVIGFYDKGNDFDGFALVLNLNTKKKNLIKLTDADTYGIISDVLIMGGKYYFFKMISKSTPSTCYTLTEVMRYNSDLSLDTTVAICNSITHSTGRNFYFLISALKLNESTFFMAARANNPDHFSNANFKEEIGILKWDTNFVELNASLHGKQDSMALEHINGISRYSNNPYFYVSGTENYVVNSSGYDTTSGYFMLVKKDLQGNELWTRYYSNDTYLNIRKVLATSDGGALMVGTSYDHTTSNGLEKDVWIVKVDSNGNYQNQTSIPENGSINKNEFVFFPNPLGDQLHFRQINVQREYNLEIFDIRGKKILEKRISKSDEVFDFSDLSSGAYIYHLLDENGNFASGKLMKK